MKTKTDIELQCITNEIVRDADGEIISENVTCETMPRLRVLDVVQYETMVKNNRPTARV